MSEKEKFEAFFGEGVVQKPKKKDAKKKRKNKNPEKKEKIALFSEEEEEKKEEEKKEEEKNEDNISVNGSIDLTSKVKLKRTVSLKRANSLKNKPLFPESLEEEKLSISLVFNAETKIYTVTLDHKTYEFDLKPQATSVFFEKTKNLNDIIEKFDDFKEAYSEKQGHKIPEISHITDHNYYTCLDCYFEHIQLLIQAKTKSNDLDNKILSPPDSELDRCCICQCDLYDSILSFTPALILNALTHPSPDQEDVIKLSSCDGHYFHKSCFLSFLQDKSFIKCPVCSRIYGIMTGDQPDWKMTYQLDKYSKCAGFEKYDTIVIEYAMRGCEREGIRYNSTHRIAYLPNNKDGREVLELLKTAFERRLIFTLGTSVTTGRTNQIVWNGIHHKTGLSGGTSYFGYPDKTYFNRVKLELAAKGVY